MNKQIFIELGFIDNEYLDQYIELLQKDFSNFTGYKERHHAIQISYYKQKYKIKTYEKARTIAEADPNNKLIELSFAEHCRAHWLLYKCATGKLKIMNAIAFCEMVGLSNKILIEQGLSTEDYNKLQRLKEELILESGYHWTNNDKEWLKQNYHKYGRNKCAELLGKSKICTGAMAFALGIQTYTLDKWTAEEDKFIKANYNILLAKDIAKQLNRTVRAIEHRVKQLNLVVPKYKWTRADDKFLAENYQKMSSKDIAAVLNRSIETIYKRIGYLGLNKIKK